MMDSLLHIFVMVFTRRFSMVRMLMQTQQSKVQVSQASNGNCIARAISTMRLALQYGTPLPPNWDIGERQVQDIISMVGCCFPDHDVVVWAHKNVWEAAVPCNNVTLGGEYIDICNDEMLDDYLYAFAYEAPNAATGGSHMVVGFPISYSEDFKVVLVIGVKL